MKLIKNIVCIAILGLSVPQCAYAHKHKKLIGGLVAAITVTSVALIVMGFRTTQTYAQWQHYFKTKKNANEVCTLLTQNTNEDNFEVFILLGMCGGSSYSYGNWHVNDLEEMLKFDNERIRTTSEKVNNNFTKNIKELYQAVLVDKKKSYRWNYDGIIKVW